MTVHGKTPLLAVKSARHVSAGSERVRAIVDLLGGKSRIRTVPTSELEIHEILNRGLVAGSMSYLVQSSKGLSAVQLCETLGVNRRTFQRNRKTPSKHLDHLHSNKIWRFAEILAKAADIFGSREKAEEWMSKPVMGLDGQVPIELLKSVPGERLVETFLDRLDHGVYT